MQQNHYFASNGISRPANGVQTGYRSDQRTSGGLENWQQLYEKLERDEANSPPPSRYQDPSRLSEAPNINAASNRNSSTSGIIAMYADEFSNIAQPVPNNVDPNPRLERSTTQLSTMSSSSMSYMSGSSSPRSTSNGLPSRPLPRAAGPRPLGGTSSSVAPLPSRSVSSSSNASSLYYSRNDDRPSRLTERQASKLPMREESYPWGSTPTSAPGSPSDRIAVQSKPLPDPHSYTSRPNGFETRRSPSIVATPPAMSAAEEQSSPVARFPYPSRSNTLSPISASSSFPHNMHRNPSGTTLNSLAPSSILYEDEVIHVNQALLTNLAVYLRDHVPRAEHTRGSIPFPTSFTGSDIVTTVMRALPDVHKNRRSALAIARSLHNQLFFFEVQNNPSQVEDGLDQVYTFIEDDVGDSSARGNDWEELPTGVFTEVTNCYSPMCARLSAYGSGGGGCFSPSCPNNLQAALLKRQASTVSEAPTTPTIDMRSWAELANPDLLAMLMAKPDEGKREIDRQNSIHELITTEMKYVYELDLLRTEFLEPLVEADPPIISPDNQSTFFSEVLGNLFDVRETAQSFSDALLNRQREHTDLIQNIGDVVLNIALDWGSQYKSYASHYPFAKASIQQEKQRNPSFELFVNTFSRRPAASKRDLDDYLQNPTKRLPRYLLMLRSILKKTSPDHQDYEALEQAIEILDGQAQEMNFAVIASEAVITCRNYQQSLVGHGGIISDLDLYNEKRQVIMADRMYRRSESSGFSGTTTLHVILFDHYLVLTKIASGKGSDKRYHISRRPIPLELLTAIGWDEPPQPRQSRLHLLRANTTAENQSISSSVRDGSDRMLYPITFNYLGRQGGIFVLFVDSDKARQEWRTRLEETQNLRRIDLEESRIFETVTMSAETFAARTSRISDQSRRDGSLIPVGRPTCSAFFTTPEGHPLVAIGHDDGLWIGLRHDPSSYRLVLHLKYITQCAVLQDFGLLLVLANKVLIAYPLEALVPSATSAASRENKEPQRLSGSKDVLFFQVGVMKTRLLVIYVKKDGVTQTVFKALEPIAIADRGTRGFMRKRQDWFREYKEFFIPSEVFGLYFLKSQLSIVCARGFELLPIDREPLRAESFPDWSKLRSDPKAMDLQKRCHESKAVAMFRITQTEFLFVFEDLAFYTDKHGDPLPSRYKDIIEFQGTARSVAYCKGYLLAFDSSFVEIRHAMTGKLVQIIQGKEILCLNDGQGLGADGKRQTTHEEADRIVHIAMREHVAGKGDFYSVVEVVPARHLAPPPSPAISNFI